MGLMLVLVCAYTLALYALGFYLESTNGIRWLSLAAADLLERQGVRTEVLKLNQISPLEYETLAPWLAGKKLLAVAEDAFGAGCVGQRTAAILAQHGQAPEKLVLINLGKTFLPEGTVPQLEHQAGIDAAGIARAVQEART